MPLLARPGSAVPFGAVDDRPEYAWADGVELRVHAPAPGQRTRVRVPAPDGGTAAVLEVVVDDAGADASVEVVEGTAPGARVRVLPRG